jgi:hypothetical protein
MILFGCLMMSAYFEQAGSLLTERESPLAWRALGPIMGLDLFRRSVSRRDSRPMGVHRGQLWEVHPGGASCPVRARVS